MASAAEERLRGKAEASLRRAWPDARIIHELVLKQGGNRIDLAAVTPDRLVVVEIKSELDVLHRLEAQVEAALKVATEVWICCTARSIDKIEDTLPGVDRCRLLQETETSFDFDHWRAGPRRTWNNRLDQWAMLDMLWADELRRLTGTPYSREPAMEHARENMTGREIRRGVLSALRRRSFPRADAPDVSPLQAGLKL